MAAAKATNVSFDSAFFIGSINTRNAVERVESIVRTQHNESLGFRTLPPDQDAYYCSFQVVVTNAPGHAAKTFECMHVSVKECFLSTCCIGAMECFARRRQAHRKQVHLCRNS